MAPSTSPGEPSQGHKPQPLGANIPMIILFTTCTLCALFIIWRRAETLRRIVSQTLHLKTWSGSEGNIRLSEDDGPSSQEFLDDDDDEDARVLDLSDSASIFDAATEAQQAFADSPPRKPTKPPGTGAS